ncbi:MAG: ERCC4 domain-containing protein [Promethearchaeati archaeon SRVP18_Atabeyarchaeia-1]
MNQDTLDSYAKGSGGSNSGRVTVFVDNRELRSRVSEYLRELDVNVVEKQLSVADYVVSDRVAVERKSVNELASSIYTNRLFDECSRLKDAYEIPILVLEGYMPIIFKMRKVNESSIWGAMTSLAVQLRISIVPTPDTKHTARFIERLAYSEQVKVKRPIVIRPKEKTLTLAQQQQYLICGLPNVGVTLADSLLSKAQTPYNVFRQIAEAEILQSKTGKTRRLSGPISDVKGIGPTIVESAKKILTSPYLKDVQGDDGKEKPLMREQNISDNAE